ncbi:aspartate kinase, partial [Schnuerera sp.]|uniref:aspartate kinase n=1 Tax=Schnuerera sp. TaxID=2794844 RepID=UPI002C655640
MKTIVRKYGGTAVETIEKMQSIAESIIRKKQEGYNIVIVVSAMGKTTNQLVEMARSISDTPCKRELDVLMATGEQVSISLLSMILKEKGYDSISLTGFQAGIRTKGIHTKSKIVEIDIDNVKKYLKEGKIVVVAGFQGANELGEITTLGRGGSDTTAVALAAKLQCACEIYTDVEGIYSVDPRLFPKAKKLDYISYEEMMEMSSLGARVMETRSIEIGYKYDVPIYVTSSHNNIKGTYVKEVDKEMEQKSITGLSVSDEVLMITINKVPYTLKNISDIFSSFANHAVNIDMISQTSPNAGFVNISFTTRLLTASRERTQGLDNTAHQQVLAEVFADFPDSESALRRQGLAFFEYRLTDAGRAADKVAEADLETLIERGLVSARPITYEDFLPISAAGIFQ